MTRKWVALPAAAALLVTGCAAPDPEGRAKAAKAQSDVITVGMLRPSTGSSAASGLDMERGWRLFWELNGDRVAGKRIRTVFEDDASNPSVGLNKARRLITSDQVDLMTGPLLANVGLAVADLVDRREVPMVLPVVSADDLTQRKRLKHVVRLAGWTSSQTTHVLGDYAYDQGHRTAVTICNDYAFGYESCGGFTNTFTDRGGKVIGKLWNPLPTPDFSTYMAQIRQADPEVVFAEEVGVDSVRFVKAWKEFGMDSTGIKLLANETVVDQAFLRSSKEAALGIVSAGHFAEGRPARATRSFVDAYHRRYGLYPSYYAAATYTAAQGVREAVAAVNGEVTDTARFLAALRAVKLADSAFGPEHLDPYGAPVFNTYIREVRPGPYGPWNVPIKTYPRVSQFWKYDPAEFLRHPVYGKNYQGDGPWPRP
ncbi:MAG: ABC transporter substrate-binding protein [Streptosporangiales bacterium]|nr:ABC transporter substrate-binding protein [Streptosporangiales bacterium]